MPPFPVEWWPRPLGTEGTGRKSGPCSHGVESGLILQYCPINQALILCNMVNGLSHPLSARGRALCRYDWYVAANCSASSNELKRRVSRFSAGLGSSACSLFSISVCSQTASIALWRRYALGHVGVVSLTPWATQAALASLPLTPCRDIIEGFIWQLFVLLF
jgi:hypothetical protein